MEGIWSRLVAPIGTKGPGDQWSRMEPPTGTNGGDLVPVGGSNQDKRAPAYIPFLPPPPPEPFSSVFLLFLARVGGVLAHFVHNL